MRGIHISPIEAWLRLGGALALAAAAWIVLLAQGPLGAGAAPAGVDGPGGVAPIEHALEGRADAEAEASPTATPRPARTRAAEQQRIATMSPTRWLARYGDVSVTDRE